MASSPPSFDHLSLAGAAGPGPYADDPIQAQICRNGRMKYRRMCAPAGRNEGATPGDAAARAPGAGPAPDRSPG